MIDVFLCATRPRIQGRKRERVGQSRLGCPSRTHPFFSINILQRGGGIGNESNVIVEWLLFYASTQTIRRSFLQQTCCAPQRSNESAENLFFSNAIRNEQSMKKKATRIARNKRDRVRDRRKSLARFHVVGRLRNWPPRSMQRPAAFKRADQIATSLAQTLLQSSNGRPFWL